METENLCTQKIPQQLHLEDLADLKSPQQKQKPQDLTPESQGGTCEKQDRSQYMKEYRERNKEKFRYYYNRNPEVWLKRWRKYLGKLVNVRPEIKPVKPVQTKEEKAAKRRAWYFKNKDRIAPIKKAWDNKNREKRNAQKQARYWEDADGFRAKRLKHSRNYEQKVSHWRRCAENEVDAHRIETIRARAREARARWRAEHKEECRKERAEYRRNNPDVFKALAMARHDRIKAGSACGTNNKMINQIYRTCARIARCTGIKHHVDHIVPLAAGGLHHESNLQILPARINLRKGAKVAA